MLNPENFTSPMKLIMSKIAEFLSKVRKAKINAK
jgi:hypothetical protein